MTPAPHPTAPPPRAEIAPDMRCEEIHGVEVAYQPQHGVWVGRCGDGRWITPDAFRELVAVLAQFAEGLS